MDGTLDELLELEEKKRLALISLKAEDYERAVDAQTDLLPRLQALERIDDRSKLAAFARLAELNAKLYENFLSTTWLAATSAPCYTGEGLTNHSSMPNQTFSAKA